MSHTLRCTSFFTKRCMHIAYIFGSLFARTLCTPVYTALYACTFWQRCSQDTRKTIYIFYAHGFTYWRPHFLCTYGSVQWSFKRKFPNRRSSSLCSHLLCTCTKLRDRFMATKNVERETTKNVEYKCIIMKHCKLLVMNKTWRNYQKNVEYNILRRRGLPGAVILLRRFESWISIQ